LKEVACYEDIQTRPMATERVMKDKPHDEAMAELYREEPDFAIAALNAVLQDGDQAELMIVLRQMTNAFGGA
jgi:DNA-binding phage protein